MNELVKFKLPAFVAQETSIVNSPDFVLGKIRTGLNNVGEAAGFIENPETYLNFFGRPWSKQIEIIESVRDNIITLVRSCNNVGKTWTAAAVILWFLDVYRPNATVVSTSKTYDSVRYMLWAALRKQYLAVKERFGGAHMNLTDFSPDIWNHPKWQAMGYNPKIEGGLNNPESEAVSFQGHHNEHILFWIDEAITTHPAIFRAIEGSLLAKGARLGCTFNPTSTQGEVVRYEKDERAHLIKISAYDLFNSPQYIAHPEDYRELTNPKKVKAFVKIYGKGSPIVLSRIDGEYPKQQINAAIDVNSFNMCIAKYDVYKGGSAEIPFESIERKIYCWDVAGDGTDSNVLGDLTVGQYKFEDNIENKKLLAYTELEAWQNAEHDESLLKVFDLIKDDYLFHCFMAKQAVLRDEPYNMPKFMLVVDAIGEGSHVPSMIKNMVKAMGGRRWLSVIAFKAANKAKKVPERREVDILNAISEAWFRSHLLIEHKVDKYPPIVINMPLKGQAEITNRLYHHAMKNKQPLVWFIEPKDDYKLRSGGGSPDKADTLVMGIYGYFKGSGIGMAMI